jgi:hypothetical protein
MSSIRKKGKKSKKVFLKKRFTNLPLLQLKKNQLCNFYSEKGFSFSIYKVGGPRYAAGSPFIFIKNFES